MSVSVTWAAVIGAVLCCGGNAVAAPPQEGRDPAPIVVSGQAEVTIPPTHAAFRVEIRTESPVAASAGADNARIAKAVMEALKNAGLRVGEVVGSQITVGPMWSYDEKSRRQKRTGYEANHSMQIDTDQLERVGLLVDAALTAGATGVSDVDFAAKNSAAARRQALAQAVAEARLDGEALARAAGGRLGKLLLLSTEPGTRQPGPLVRAMSMTAKRDGEPVPVTQITRPEITVAAQVEARWEFVPSNLP